VKTLVCWEFQTPSFLNGDTQLWDSCINRVEQWSNKYQFGQSVKELFYELLQRGYCRSVVTERVEKAYDVLKQEGYEPSIEERQLTFIYS